MKRFLAFYLVLGAAVCVEILADAFLKKSASGGSIGFFFAGVVLCGTTTFPVVYLFNRRDFEIVFLLWEAFGVFLGIAVANLYFREALSVQKGLAVVFSIGAIVCSYF